MPRKKYWRNSRRTSTYIPPADVHNIDNTNINSGVNSERDKTNLSSSQGPSQSQHDCDTNINMINDRSSIQGSFHQGHPHFLPHSGRQCVANSCVALLLNEVKSSSQWVKGDIDLILETGNELYGSLQKFTTITDAYLLINELPHIVEVFNQTFSLTVGQPCTGMIDDCTGNDADGFTLMSLENALHSTFEDFDSCFINFANSTFVAMHIQNAFFLFDPHSRDVRGMLAFDGKSTLIHFDNIADVYNHCQNLAESMHVCKKTMFEVTGVKIDTEEPMLQSNTVPHITDKSCAQHTYMKAEIECSETDIEKSNQNQKRRSSDDVCCRKSKRLQSRTTYSVNEIQSKSTKQKSSEKYVNSEKLNSVNQIRG